MKARFLGLCAAAALGLFTLTAVQPARAADEMVFKSSDVHPIDYPTVVAVVHMGEKLKAETGGRLSIEVFPSMQLGGEKEALEQVQLGALAMTRVSVGPMGAISPELNVLALPFVFRDVDHMHAIIDGVIGDELLLKITDNPNSGLVGLGWMDAGARNFYNDKVAIKSVADFAGLKLRTMGNPIFVEMVNALGGNGISMGFDQLVGALETGVVDGAENNYPSYVSGQHYLYAPYYSLTQHLILPEVLVFSKKVWDTLSPSDQELLRKLAREAQMEERTLWAAKEQEALAVMKEKGVTITEIADKAAFQAAMKPVWDKFGAEHAEMIARIQAVQ
jgi:tripartite ATP-independent transporter DctP family solute receptor